MSSLQRHMEDPGVSRTRHTHQRPPRSAESMFLAEQSATLQAVEASVNNHLRAQRIGAQHTSHIEEESNSRYRDSVLDLEAENRRLEEQLRSRQQARENSSSNTQQASQQMRQTRQALPMESGPVHVKSVAGHRDNIRSARRMGDSAVSTVVKTAVKPSSSREHLRAMAAQAKRDWQRKQTEQQQSLVKNASPKAPPVTSSTRLEQPSLADSSHRLSRLLHRFERDSVFHPPEIDQHQDEQVARSGSECSFGSGRQVGAGHSPLRRRKSDSSDQPSAGPRNRLMSDTSTKTLESNGLGGRKQQASIFQARGSEPMSEQAADAGQVTELVSSLGSTDDSKTIATVSVELMNLARQHDNRLLILENDALPRLLDHFKRLVSAHNTLPPDSQREDIALLGVLGTLFNLTQERNCHAHFHSSLGELVMLCETSHASEVLELAAGTLGSLALADRRLRLTIGQDGIASLLCICEEEADDGARAMACAALWSLACSSANRRVITEYDGIKIISKLLSKSKAEQVLEQAAGILGSLTWHQPVAAEQLIDAGGLDQLVHVLRSCPDAGAKFRALGTIGQLTDGDKSRSKLVQLSLLPVLLGLCKSSEDEDIVAASAAAIWGLIHKSPAEQRELYEINGIQALVVACQRLPSSQVIARSAGALGALCDTLKYRQAILTVQGHVHLMNGARANLSDSRAVNTCCQTLRAIVRGSFRREVVEFIVWLLQQTSSNRVAVSAATILWDISFKDIGVCLELVALGVVEALLDLIKSSKKATVVQTCCATLNALARCHQSAKCICLAKGASIIASACRLFVRDGRVSEAATSALCSLALAQECCEFVVEVGGVDIFLGLVRSWEGDPTDQEADRLLAIGMGGLHSVFTDQRRLKALLQHQSTADLITALGKVCRLCESVDVLLDTTAVLLDASAHSNAPMWPLVSEASDAVSSVLKRYSRDSFAPKELLSNCRSFLANMKSV